MSLAITPETRVGALLEAYPGIEGVLIDAVPAFEKLRNPVLRKTVAKVATLEQAARVGGVSVRDLVRKLREATGQSAPELVILSNDSGGGGAGGRGGEAPRWVARGMVREEIDADGMLATGVHPIGRVREGAAALGAGELLILRSGFRPEPLLETMRRAGLQVYCAETEPGRFASYFGRV
jgi:hypothetical protein